MIFSLSSVTSFSYVLFLILFVCDGLHDGEVSCLQKRLDGLADHSLSFMFLLLGLEMVFVKPGLFSRAQAVTPVYEGCTQFSWSSWKSVSFAAGFGL